MNVSTITSGKSSPVFTGDQLICLPIHSRGPVSRIPEIEIKGVVTLLNFENSGYSFRFSPDSTCKALLVSAPASLMKRTVFLSSLVYKSLSLMGGAEVILEDGTSEEAHILMESRNRGGEQEVLDVTL